MDMQKKNNRNKKRHSRKRKQPISLKLIFSGFFALMLILSGICLMQFVENKQLEKRVAKQTTLLLNQVKHEQEKNELATEEKVTKKANLVEVSYPPSEIPSIDGFDFDQITQESMKKMEKKLNPKDPAVLVSHLAINHYTEQLAAYEVAVDLYLWQNKSEEFIKTKTKTTKPVLINHSTGQLITRQDLIKKEENLLGIQQVIQQMLLDQAADPNLILDEVLNLPRLSWDTPMTYTEEQLVVQLPQNKLGQTTIALPYAKIQPFIQTDLVKPEYLIPPKQALDANQKYVALTFDDGPSPVTTPKIIQILANKGIKATFFLLGQNVKENPELTKQIFEGGHELASHSYSHPSFNNISKEAIKKEVIDTDKAIFEATGCLPKILRPPYGAINTDTAKVVGKPIIQWNVDSLDWKTKNSAAIQKVVKNSVASGGIILMHDIQPATAEALDQVINDLKAQNYQFVTIEELLEQKMYPMHQYFGQFDQRNI